MEVIPFTEDPLGNLRQFIIPALLTGMFMSGVTMRMTRTMMLEVLRQDYIRTAFAKGLKERLVVSRHALKNALIPVITIAGLELPLLVGGTVIIEQIFALPGIGRLLLDSLHIRGLYCRRWNKPGYRHCGSGNKSIGGYVPTPIWTPRVRYR